MQNYIDYNFYENVYGGGSISPSSFLKYSTKASSIVDYYTFNRIEDADNKVKFAVCELMDYLKEVEDRGGKEIESEKVSTHSITYASSTKEGVDPVKQRQKDIVRKYLGHSGLMYRGCRYEN